MKANNMIILIGLYHPNCSDGNTIKNSIPLAMEMKLYRIHSLIKCNYTESSNMTLSPHATII